MLKNAFLFLIAMGATNLASAQIDSPTGDNTGLDIPFGSGSDGVNISNSTLTIPNFGLDNPDDVQGFGQFQISDTLSLGETEDEGIKFTTDTGLLTNTSDKAPKYFTKDKEEKDEFRRNQFFGQYTF